MKKILVSLAPLRGDGAVSGINPQAAAKIKSDIANLSNNPQQLDPPFLLFPHELTLDGKTVIAVQALGSSARPFPDGHYAKGHFLAGPCCRGEAAEPL